MKYTAEAVAAVLKIQHEALKKIVNMDGHEYCNAFETAQSIASNALLEIAALKE